MASTAKRGDDTALDRTIDSRWPSCHRQGGLGQETRTQESGDGAPSGLTPQSKGCRTCRCPVGLRSSLRPLRLVLSAGPQKSRDSSPLFGKALYYGAAGISEKDHDIGLRPGERIHSFPPAYLAARCSGGARRTSGLQPGDLLDGPLPWVDNRDLFAYDFGLVSLY